MNKEENENRISVTQKYKAYMIRSFFRVLIVRAASLFYVLIFYRLIGDNKIDLGLIVILSIGTLGIGAISDLGMFYTYSQWTLTEKKAYKTLAPVIYGVFLGLTLPITLVSSFFWGLIVLNDLNMIFLLFLINNVLWAFFQLLIRGEYFAQLQMDKIPLFEGVYYTLSFVLVPIMYFLFPTVESILLSGIISKIIGVFTGIYLLPIKIKIWKIQKDFVLSRSALLFAFPIFVLNALKFMDKHLDKVLIYYFFGNSDVAVYSAVKNIVDIFNSTLLTITYGLFPLFAVYMKKNRKDGIRILFTAYRVTGTLTLFILTMVYINSAFFLKFFLGDQFNSGLVVFEILILGYTFVAFAYVLEIYDLGYEKRKKLVIGFFIVLLTEIIFILVFNQLNFVAAAIGIIVGKIIFNIYFLVDHEVLSSLKKESLGRFYLFILVIFIAEVSIKGILQQDFIINIIWIIVFIFLTFIFKPFKEQDIKTIRSLLPGKTKSFSPLLIPFSQ